MFSTNCFPLINIMLTTTATMVDGTAVRCAHQRMGGLFEVIHCDMRLDVYLH